jgi:hypothetical protein
MWAAGEVDRHLQRGDWGEAAPSTSRYLTGLAATAGEIIGMRRSPEFSNYLHWLTYGGAAVTANGGEPQRVGVVIRPRRSRHTCRLAARQYHNVHWWGSDGTAKSQRAMDDAPEDKTLEDSGEETLTRGTSLRQGTFLTGQHSDLLGLLL